MGKFKIALSANFTHLVEAELAGEDAPKKISFTGIFARATQEEVDAMVTAGKSDDAIARERLVGWKDGVAEGVAFGEDALNELLAIDGMRSVIARAFFAGNSTATRKNL